MTGFSSPDSAGGGRSGEGSAANFKVRKALRIETVVSRPFEENCYLAWLEGRQDCLVFDPGTEPGKIVQRLEKFGLVPAAIVLTHGHADHIAGNAALREQWPELPIVIGRGDEPMLSDPVLNLSAPFGMALTSPPADQLLDEGDVYTAAGIELQVREIPGHSPGHVVYAYQGTAPTTVFGGDVLFAGSVGRTDFPGGDFETLARGIRAKLFTLPPDTIVLPGHGPSTTVGAERRSNPFVGGE